MTNDELMKKRQEELQHIADIRSHYQTKLQQVNTLYIELKSLMMQLEQREQELKKKERLLNIQHHSSQEIIMEKNEQLIQYQKQEKNLYK